MIIATDNEFRLEIGENKILIENFKNVQILLKRVQIVEIRFSLDLTKAAAFVREKVSHALERQII